MKKRVFIVGAGITGSILAERCANVLGAEVVIIDKRPHIAGNCYDYFHKSGVFLHKYGPHYFRTDSKKLLDYLSGFTKWIKGEYIVQSSINGRYYDFPINLWTLEKIFGRRFTPASAKTFLAKQTVRFENPRSVEEYCLNTVGRKLYEMFYKEYTLKQWGIPADEIHPSVAARVPVRFSRDRYYVSHRYKLMPTDGYTKMIANMLLNPLIKVELETDYFKRSKYRADIFIYTGCVDEYYAYKNGRLGYRSLSFVNRIYDKKYAQHCVQVNYPTLRPNYTRKVEIKHVTRQDINKTVVTYEYPRDSGEPFYPVPSEANYAMWQKYKLLIKSEEKNKKFFCGRLASYRYMNMDVCMEDALNMFERLKKYA